MDIKCSFVYYKTETHNFFNKIMSYAIIIINKIPLRKTPLEWNNCRKIHVSRSYGGVIFSVVVDYYIAKREICIHLLKTAFEYIISSTHNNQNNSLLYITYTLLLVFYYSLKLFMLFYSFCILQKCIIWECLIYVWYFIIMELYFCQKRF